MKKMVLVDFDAIGYRNEIIKLKNAAREVYEDSLHTLDGAGAKCMFNAFDICLEKMEEFATLEVSE